VPPVTRSTIRRAHSFLPRWRSGPFEGLCA
jgi:hypothetical protein